VKEILLCGLGLYQDASSAVCGGFSRWSSSRLIRLT